MPSRYRFPFCRWTTGYLAVVDMVKRFVAQAFGVMLLSAVILLPTTVRAERRVALVIGNAQYREGPLANPVNDARDMRDRLLTLGFEKSNIVYRENLKTAEIGALLREWRSRLTAGPDTVALVFYAGHGVQIRGENYLPTVDARVDGEEDLPHQAVKLADLTLVMVESKTRINLVFLDACRNNPYARRFRDGTRGLAVVQPPSGTLIMHATAPGSVASDGSGRNGVFTQHLLANMATPNMPVEMMLKKVNDDVFSSTQGKQDPWPEGSIRGFFYFAQGAAPDQPKQEPARESALATLDALEDPDDVAGLAPRLVSQLSRDGIFMRSLRQVGSSAGRSQV